MKAHILIVDDEAAICVSLKYTLSADYNVSTAGTSEEALAVLERSSIQLVLLDLFLGRDDGIELLKQIKERQPNVVIIVMTAHGSIRSSVTAIKSGAFTYMTKPLDLEELKLFIHQGLHYQSLNEKVAYLSSELQERYQYGEMIGKSPAIQKVYDLVDRLKDLDTPVVVTGESGTGKELVVRAIHFMGARKNESFIEVNCAAIPEGLLEMEFFGYKRGAFTGATGDKKGKFEAADKGTLFLDEIGDMPLSLQGKLLRVLQEKRFSPIGSNESRSIDVRVVAATNRDLWQMVQNGTFRQDLYYRLSVITIQLPPLRQRKQDIPLLTSRFIAKLNEEHKRNVKGVTREVERLLLTYDYPGNVRELQNIMEFAVVMCNQEYIGANDMPRQFLQQVGVLSSAEPSSEEGRSLYEIEKQAILRALERNQGHQRKTAEELGISERGLHNKLKEYGYQKSQRGEIFSTTQGEGPESFSDSLPDGFSFKNF